MKDEFFDQIASIIASALSVEIEKVTLDAEFTNDLGADSLDTAEMIMELEESFGYAVDEEDIKSISTVRDLVEYMKKKKLVNDGKSG